MLSLPAVCNPVRTGLSNCYISLQQYQIGILDDEEAGFASFKLLFAFSVIRSNRRTKTYLCIHSNHNTTINSVLYTHHTSSTYRSLVHKRKRSKRSVYKTEMHSCQYMFVQLQCLCNATPENTSGGRCSSHASFQKSFKKLPALPVSDAYHARLAFL
jgi:hypothetical protein